MDLFLLNRDMLLTKENFDIYKTIRTDINEESIISDLVEFLIISLYTPSKEIINVCNTAKIKELGIDGEPINFGDLHCLDVKKQKDYFEIIISEAAPNECENFCSYIQNFLFSWGWKCEVVTEW